MRLGALVLQEQSWREARRTWELVEELGFDAGYAADHLTHASVAGRWWADCWTTLAAAAGVTERLRLGTLVASAAVRTPTVLARCASTLQDISGGRFVLGLGAGLADDARADRGAAPAAGELWERYEETVSAVRALWLGSSTWSGRVVALDGVTPAPHAPGQLPPKVVLAAGGRRGFDLVARQGDGWVTYGGSSLVDLDGDAWWRTLARQSRQVTTACERIVRDPVSVQRSVLVGYGSYRPLESVEAFVDAVGQAQDAGFDEVVVYAPVGAPGDRFWCDPDVFAAAVRAVRVDPTPAGAGLAPA
jgi:alkanesulfonate monooxygenase SsuD/methylene tetrahydromethanopterin reductase-like flavin-dependent oxidoreductase (luciferase family)